MVTTWIIGGLMLITQTFSLCQPRPAASRTRQRLLREHAGAKIHILSKNSHIENPNFYKIHLSEISIFTKFTFLKSHFSQNSHFWNLIFHKIHVSEISIFTFLDSKINGISGQNVGFRPSVRSQCRISPSWPATFTEIEFQNLLACFARERFGVNRKLGGL